jgi:signal transduction histidine kinase
MEIMPIRTQQKKLLPYLIACIGVVLSFSGWYILKEHIWAYFNLYYTLKKVHPWLDLLFGIILSMMVGMMVGFFQLIRQKTHMLELSNQELELEISERKNAAETRKKLEAALLQGQKLQAIGTLAGGIAHDFNNILYAITGYVELAREDIGKETKAYKNLGKVLDAAHRGQDLIARILAFSRRQHYQFEAIPINLTIESALSLLKPTIPASVSIHFHPAKEIRVLGNQNQLHQVLVNLITNAVDAMDGDGVITIQTTMIEQSAPELKQLTQALACNYCKIEITDTGKGIDSRNLERIFEPFFTTKDVGKGTGLGLSIVHSIIKEHQGDINVTSQLGKGTVFTVLLPEYQA